METERSGSKVVQLKNQHRFLLGGKGPKLHQEVALKDFVEKLYIVMRDTNDCL